MIRNYFIIAWRNMIKSRFYSAVNIIGLSTGIAFTLLIAGYIWSELQVNHNLKNANNQYIVQSKWKDPGMGAAMTTIGYFPRALKEQYPNLVANYYRWDGVGSNVSKGDKHFREGLQICDSSLFSMYGFVLLSGNANTAFADPFSVVITADKAIKYFGKTDVVGQSLSIENFSGGKHDFLISGVMENPAKNSVTSIDDNNINDFFLPTTSANFFGRSIDSWKNPYIVGYVELQKGVTPKDLEAPIKQLLKLNASPQMAENLTPVLVPIKDYYLMLGGGSVKKTIYTLSFIAFFIMLMAIVNFVNMSVSRSSTRMKEIGIRKVLGGFRKQLILQFLTESILLALLATVLALFLYELARPLFSDVLGKPIISLFGFPLFFIMIPFILAMFTGLVSGIYPAFVLSSMKSVDSLKGKLKTVKEKVAFRKILVAFQFGTAAMVFICAIIVTQQIGLFFSKSLGYDKDYLVYAAVPRDWSPAGVKKMEAIRSQFEELPEVRNATLSYEIPNGNNGNNIQVFREGLDSTKAVSSQLLLADNHYAATYTIPMKAGAFFTPVYLPTDSAKIVINESQSKAFGWNDPAKAIGGHVIFQGSGIVWTVSGVTSDFHFGSMQGIVMPVTFVNVNFNPNYRFFSFKLKPGNLEKGIAALQKKWGTLLPGAPFEYRFMDDALKALYQSEIQLKKASYTATVLALIIVLLGVIGMISLSIQKRMKEVGIRKILGSSVWGIITVFLKEFLLIILIAGLIACPLTYYLMHNWLNDYAYRVTITPVPFISCILLLGVVTALLIAIQTIRVALANPVKSLRSE